MSERIEFKVKIPASYIPAIPPGNGLQTGTAATIRSQEQQARASDSYRKNSTAQVIDAEYVEFYSPTAGNFVHERQNLDSQLAADQDESRQGSNRPVRANNALDSYQKKPRPEPPPGSYLDIFA